MHAYCGRYTIKAMGRQEDFRRRQLEKLREPVQQLAKMGGRRLGNRPYREDPNLKSNQTERLVIIESPNRDRWYKISELYESQSSLYGKNRRIIETITDPYNPAKTRWDLNILPDSQIVDIAELETWSNVAPEEIRRRTRHLQEGVEMNTQDMPRRFAEAVWQALENFPEDRAS